MLLLAIDTAGPDCAAGIARGREMLWRRAEAIGRGHAERLIPLIEEGFRATGLSYGDLERIAVTTGPGSFTGVRIGIAAARALALALRIPAVGLGSLEALLAPAARGAGADWSMVARGEATVEKGTILAVLDARRGEVYAVARDLASGEVLIEAQALRPERLASLLDPAKGPLILTGAGAPLILPALAGRDVTVVGTAAAPDIAEVARLGLEAPVGAPPVPLYGRGADAKPQADKAVLRA
jgi:tRNA threonylcarbamoyladenosine biosynthesis protein TsaB